MVLLQNTDSSEIKSSIYIHFPLVSIPSERDCYDYLISILHPQGLHCPNGHSLNNCNVYKRNRTPIIDYRCKACGKCFNIFTGTVLKGSKYKVDQIIHCIDGISRGITIAKLSREMHVDRKGLKKICDKLKPVTRTIKTQKLKLNWQLLLKNIEGWAIKDDHTARGQGYLVLRMKNGNVFKLTHERVRIIINDETDQGYFINKTKVEKVPYYLRKEYFR